MSFAKFIVPALAFAQLALAQGGGRESIISGKKKKKNWLTETDKIESSLLTGFACYCSRAGWFGQVGQLSDSGWVD